MANQHKAHDAVICPSGMNSQSRARNLLASLGHVDEPHVLAESSLNCSSNCITILLIGVLFTIALILYNAMLSIALLSIAAHDGLQELKDITACEPQTTQAVIFSLSDVVCDSSDACERWPAFAKACQVFLLGGCVLSGPLESKACDCVAGVRLQLKGATQMRLSNM